MPIRVPNVTSVATGLDSNDPIETRIAALSNRTGDWLVASLFPELLSTADGKIASFLNKVTGGSAFAAADATDRAALAKDTGDTDLAVADFDGADGTDPFVYVLGGTQPDVTGAFSWVVFFKPVAGQDETVFGAWDDASTHCALWLFDSTTKARFRFSGSYVDASGTYTAGAWNYAVCTYDGSDTISISLNGAAFDTQGSVTEAAITSDFVIGDGRQGTEQQHFTGSFRRLTLFNADISGNSTAIQVWKDYFEWVLGGTLAS